VTPRFSSLPTGTGRNIGLTPAVAVLVSNMIGTGVFTSLGLQVTGTHTGFALLTLWALGGVAALCGAACYAELSAAMPRSGGEYVYLGEIFHPFVGFLGGWVSMTVGFAAPIALAGIAFGRYLSAVVPITPLEASVAAIAVVTVVHAAHLTLARRFQIAVTAVIVVLIVGFILAGVRIAQPTTMSFAPSRAAVDEIISAPFAVSLIYVSYAYSGWNAAGYIAGEIRDPQRTLPRALGLSAVVVTVLYVSLNWAFLRAVPIDRLSGVIQVGTLAAGRMGGPVGARLMSGIIAAVLVGAMSAMVLAGSRVTEAIVADLPALRGVAARSRGGVPRNAILAQIGLTVVLLLSNAFEPIVTYAGFTLEAVTLLAIAGLVVRRRRGAPAPGAVRAWGYPVTAVVYAAISVWTLLFVVLQRPLESLAGVATLLVGAVLWKWLGRVEA
jgi:basic amino acid/polyamine antiporter, APA family